MIKQFLEYNCVNYENRNPFYGMLHKINKTEKDRVPAAQVLLL